MSGADDARIGFVAIGRNEGERLARCLQSLPRQGSPAVYVDSGSTDASVATAQSLGVGVVSLEDDRPFTAARARNAGFAKLVADWPDVAYVMFIDGDCELAPEWPRTAAFLLDDYPEVAVVCGRLRERRPDASLYNRLCDIEWDAPAGDTIACGGVAMHRRSAFAAAGGFDEALVGGEEPELCVRLREQGWAIRRLEAEMAVHDAAITSFLEWADRMKRGGRAFAQVSHLHRRSPQRIWRREEIRALFWAAILPASLLGALVVNPGFLALLAAYPLQVLRLATIDRGKLAPSARERPWVYAIFMTIAKFPEAAGVLEFHLGRLAATIGAGGRRKKDAKLTARV
ncbi:MAG: glycosyltransferase [Parvularculaceae bacterium]